METYVGTQKIRKFQSKIKNWLLITICIPDDGETHLAVSSLERREQTNTLISI